jgi:geranylgeranyl diphosphate synthase type II
MTDYREKYLEMLKIVEQKIDEYVKIKHPTSIYEPFRYIMDSGGKRIRPMLAMICCGAVCGEPERALNGAVAIEILHNFTLAHDDLMDNSPFRRGRQTIHLKWDEPTAILTGDVMVGCAYALLPNFEQNRSASRIYEEFTKALIVVCEGQALDMEFDRKPSVVLADYFEMIEKKTAALLTASAAIGARCGDADEDLLKLIKEYAWNLGIAFQLQDDLLDLTADEANFGKKIGQDIIEGKKTYLILKANEKALDLESRKLLDNFYIHHGLPEEKVPAVRAMMQQYGVFNDIATEIDSFYRIAKSNLEKLPQSEYKEMLCWLTDTLLRRNY